VDAHPDSAATARSVPRTTRRRIAALIGLVGFLCLPVSLVIFLQHLDRPELLHPGDPAPRLVLMDLDSNEISLVEPTGKRVALLVFSVDCSHCLREAENFRRLHSQFAENIRFLAVSSSETQKTRNFVGSTHFPVTTLLDRTGEVTQRFGISAVPALFLFDSDGTIRFRTTGEKSLEARRRLLSAFIHNELGTDRSSRQER
jgi:peroxiredoxin